MVVVGSNDDVLATERSTPVQQGSDVVGGLGRAFDGGGDGDGAGVEIEHGGACVRELRELGERASLGVSPCEQCVGEGAGEVEDGDVLEAPALRQALLGLAVSLAFMRLLRDAKQAPSRP